MSLSSSSDTSVAMPAPGAAAPFPLSRALWIAAGAVVLTAAGVAAALSSAGHPASALAGTPPAAAAQEGSPNPLRRVAQAPQGAPATSAGSRSTTASPSPAVSAGAVCKNCGVVESVQPIKVKGEGTGVGAVAGGVLGGVLGHQVGGGSGKTAMTVLGAAGGAYAGHQVEKNMKSTTVYSVKLRMDDGSVQTLQQSVAPAIGAKVRVEGNALHAL